MKRISNLTRLPSEIPFERDAASRFLPWIVAIMVYLAALAITGAIAVNGAVGSWSSGLSGTMTVQIPTATDQKKTKADYDKILNLLRVTPGLQRVKPLSRKEVAALVRPWLGKDADSPDLPLPALIEITVKEDTQLNLSELASRIRAISPNATLENHEKWVGGLVGFARSVWLVALLIVALIAASAIITIIFATRTGLRIHFNVIEVLHVIGARDRYIAGLFEKHALRLTLKGALVGVLFAILTAVAMAYLAAQMEILRTPRFVFTPWQWVGLACVPIGATLVAFVTARLTVLRTLSRLS